MTTTREPVPDWSESRTASGPENHKLWQKGEEAASRHYGRRQTLSCRSAINDTALSKTITLFAEWKNYHKRTKRPNYNDFALFLFVDPQRCRSVGRSLWIERVLYTSGCVDKCVQINTRKPFYTADNRSTENYFWKTVGTRVSSYRFWKKKSLLGRSDFVRSTNLSAMYRR